MLRLEELFWIERLLSFENDVDSSTKFLCDNRQCLRFSVSADQLLVICLGALESSVTDFEDALQYFTAETMDMNYIVTRNGRDYRFGDIIAVNAQEIIDLITTNDDVET